MNRSLKSTLPSARPRGGMTMSFTSEVTMAPKAAPIITAMARSSTLPRMTNSLNSLSIPRYYYSALLHIQAVGMHEAALKGAVEEIVGQLEGKLLEMDQVDGVGDGVAGLAAPEPLAGARIVPLDKLRDPAGGAFQPSFYADAPEDLCKF